MIMEFHKINCKLHLLFPIILASLLMVQYTNAFTNKAKFSDIKKNICIWKTLEFMFMKQHLIVKLPYFFQASFIRETDDYYYTLYLTECSVMLEGG